MSGTGWNPQYEPTGYLLEGNDLPMGIELFDDSPDPAFSGRLHVGPIAASPPAKN